MNINFHREFSPGQLDISQLSSHFTVRFLWEKDIPAIYDLCAGNPQYYEHCPPAVTSEGIRADMMALPPGKDYHDKYYIAFFAGEMLAVVMDLFTGYPDDDTAWIGLFMVERSVQKKGVERPAEGYTVVLMEKKFRTKR